MEINKVYIETQEAAKAAGAFIRICYGKVAREEIISKGVNNLVSYVDINAEKLLVEKLQAILPEAGFLTEEGTIKQEREKKYRWIIDPLDGTTNFLHEIPMFSVSIALQEDEKTILGVVYNVMLDECFHACKGKGAFLNETPIKVSETADLLSSIIATGFPYDDHGTLDRYVSILAKFIRNTRAFRRMGSAAIDLAYVACGRFDAFFEFNLNAWDVAAGALIVQEAGGVVTDFSEGEDYIFGKEIAAASTALHPAFLKAIQ